MDTDGLKLTRWQRERIRIESNRRAWRVMRKLNPKLYETYLNREKRWGTHKDIYARAARMVAQHYPEAFEQERDKARKELLDDLQRVQGTGTSNL